MSFIKKALLILKTKKVLKYLQLFFANKQWENVGELRA